jgi:hypothetical protein
MTLKQDMVAEAEKLGATVRQALTEFAAKTGMQAEIGITWVTFQRLESAGTDTTVDHVRVDVGGMSVSA